MGLKGLCKAAERSKVTLGKKIREEKTKKDEQGNVLEKSETVKVEEFASDIPVNADAEFEAVIDRGEASELLVDEGLTKKEEKTALDEIANAPGRFEKSSKRKGKR